MSREKQIEFERNEMSEIIAKSFKLNDEQYDASDFEWSAHQLQMAGFSKKGEIVKEFVKRFEFHIKDCQFTIGQAYDIDYALRKATEEMKGGAE